MGDGGIRGWEWEEMRGHIEDEEDNGKEGIIDGVLGEWQRYGVGFAITDK